MKIKHIIGHAWFVAGLMILGLVTAQAQTSATWTGASGGEWNTAANWNTAIVPGVGTNAIINSTTTANYNLPMSATTFGMLSNNGVLNMNTNGFNNTGVVMVYPNGTGKMFLNTGAVVNVTGNLGYCSNSVVAMTAGTSLTISGVLVIGSDITGNNSGTATASAFGVFTNNGGILTAGSVNLNPRNQSIGTSCLLMIRGGTNNLGAYSAQRSPGGNNAPPALGTDGLVISNGLVTTTSISVGNNAHGIMYLVGGIVTNTGNLTVKNTTGTRPARFVQAGGLFNTVDPSLAIMNPSGTGDAVYAVTGGTNIVGGLELGTAANTGTNYFTNTASIYVGSQGIVSNGACILYANLNNGGLFGATANWASSVNMKLTGGTFSFSPVDLSGNSHMITWSGVLSGAGSLLVTNAGILVLANTNAYTGNTTIGTGSMLQLGDGINSNGVVAGYITNNGALTVANPNPQTLAPVVFGPGSLVESGPGILTLTGTNVYTGGTTISGGVLQLGDGATTDGAVAGNIADNATLTVADPTAQTFTNLVTGSGSLVMNGPATLTVSANETYAGSTVVNAGSLVVSAIGSINSTQNVTIASGGLLDVSASPAGGYTLGSGYVFTAGHTSSSGPDFHGNLTSYGTLSIPASSTFTLNGNLSLKNGGTSIFNLGISPSAGSTIALSSGALSLNGTTTVQINFTVLGVGTYPLISGASSVSGSLGNLNLVLNGSLGLYTANLQVTATGVNLVVAGNPHNLVWQGDGSANSWDNNTGNTDWSNVVTHAVDYFAAGYYVTFDNTGAANQPELNAVVLPATTTINGTMNYTFSGGGYISSGILTNNTTGTLYVQTPNTYSGGTVINAGTVEVDTGGAIGSGPVLNNAALTYNRGDTGNNTGVISGPGSVTMENSGTEILSAANTYSGGTTISSGTLQLGKANALPGGTVAGDVNNNGTLDLAGYSDTINGLSGGGTVDTLEGGTPTLAVGGNGDSGTFSGIIQNTSGTLNLAKAGAGTETLGNANTYGGNTTISNGTLAVGVMNALPVGTTVTLGGSGTAGMLDLDGNSQQVAGLVVNSGAVGARQIIGNSSGSPATLIFTNNSTSTFGGTIQDVLGSGSSTVALTVNGGSLILNGTNNYSGGTTINSGGNTLLTVSGGLLAGTTMTMNSANASRGFLLSGGTASFSGTVTFSADNGNNGNFMNLTGGTFDAASLVSGRSGLNVNGAAPTAGQNTSDGIYVDGATVNITNTLGVGGYNAGANSSGSMRLDAGTVNVGGTTTITLNNASRWTVLDINGGIFTSTDSTGAGIQIGGGYAGDSAELLVRAGTASVVTITLGDAGTQTTGTNLLNVTGGTLYIGSGGIVQANASPTYLNTNKLGTATIGAQASWSTSLPMGLSGTTTFQAADGNNNPFNITLNGTLSGSDILVKTGGGILTLGAADTYSGNTLINGGTLALGASGSLASPNIILNTNAIFDVSQVTGGFSLNNNQSIKGFGMVNGAVTAASGSLIYPGSNAVTGTLTFAGGLTEGGGVNNEFNLSSNPSGPSNDLVTVSGALTVSGSNPILISGSVQSGGVYPLISYAGGSFSGSTAGFMVSGASGALSNSVTAKTIYFVAQSSVRGPTNVTWKGNAVANNWDTEITTNWLDNGVGPLDFFVPGDSALFNNQGVANPLVNIAGTVTPGSVTVNTTSGYTFTGTGVIGGVSSLTVSNGTLTILTTNSFTGPVILDGGVLSTPVIANSGSPSGIGAATADPANLILNGGTLSYSGVIAASTDHNITLTNAGGGIGVTGGASLTLAGTLTGGGGLTEVGNGTLILPNANSYTGSTAINGGVLQINTPSAVSSAAITFSNGALAYNPAAGITVANPFNFISGTTNMIIVTSGGGANPLGNGSWSGGGLLIISNTVNPYTVNGVLDGFTGTVLLATPNGSGLRFNSGGGNTCFGSTNATFNLGTDGVLLDRNGGTMNLGALEGGAGSSLQYQDADTGTTIWSIGNNNLSTTFSGVIEDNPGAERYTAVTKVGAGTLTLAGQNTYSGNTIINSGVLALTNNPTTSQDGSIGDSATIDLVGTVIDVSGRSDGTLPLGSAQTLEGTGIIRGSLDASGMVEPGIGTGPGGTIGTLIVTNNVILESSSTAWFKISRASSPNSDQIVVSNSVTYNSGTLDVVNIGGTLQAGDTFKLFESTAASYGGSFGTLTLPTLAGSLAWNTSNLGVNGTISVVTAGVPSISSVDFSGLAGGTIVLNAINGPANASVNVLTSTNLALPVSQWPTNSTTSFDGNGNLTGYSITVNLALPQLFILLQAQ